MIILFSWMYYFSWAEFQMAKTTPKSQIPCNTVFWWQQHGEQINSSKSQLTPKGFSCAHTYCTLEGGLGTRWM